MEMEDLQHKFNALVGQYKERLYYLVRRFVPTHEDADDVLQEVFIKLWQHLPSFRGDSDIYTWIYRIAVNESLSVLRKRKVRAALSFVSYDSFVDKIVDEDPLFDGTALQAELYKAVAALPSRQQSVFVLRYFEQMSYAQISAVMGVTEGSLKASYHIAYEKIKARLTSHF